MAKGKHQKQKLLYLVKIFEEKTDEQHGLSVQEIISLLGQYDIAADRKTIYQDLEELRHFGMDIVSSQQGRCVRYHLTSREFELPELKLLVDSVQSSKFITERKSGELIRKLEALVSVHEAKQLHRQVILAGRVKAMNESIYYSIDKIHDAIGKDLQIQFQYFQWNVQKKPELRHGGAWYYISPWALVWYTENYYLIGYDAEAGKIKHYRVDKMLHLEVYEKKREGRTVFQEIDLPKYSRGLFGMFGGETVRVTLLCENHMAGPLLDRFGKDIAMIPVDEGHFQTHVEVAVSRQFLGWIVGLGRGVRIVAPQHMVDAMREEIRRLSAQYVDASEA